ncbi:MAG: DinB family protein [Rhodovibrionaceae bacterium]
MATPDHFQLLARYNAWANARLYAAVAALPAGDFARDLGGFFGSLRGTLNHNLAGDLIWFRRLTGQGKAPEKLDSLLFEDLAELRAAREAEDARILAYAAALTPEALAGTLRYRNTRGEPFAQPLPQVLAHVFNHQTHHRGQAHHMLSQLGASPPPLDLLYYLREAG